LFAKVQKLSFDAIFLDKGAFLNNFFSELKRRNVVRVGVAYAVVTWLVIQMGDIAADNLNFPDWFMPMVFVVLGLGFPIVLIFSWAYEVTPEGVMKTEEVDKSKSVTHGTGKKINKLIIGALVLAVGFLLYDKFMLGPNQPIVEDAKAGPISIAVLPFINMSSDTEQEYFSDGITEELLNTLAKVPGLMVAARTSVFSYKGKNMDVREIGSELGVTTILEGSVRKAGDDLRITAQLIRVSDGFHLWSETYDRRLENVFAIQEEIAFAIADALKTPLGINAGELVSNRTTDMGAYELYLQARQLVRKRGSALEEAVIILDEVIAREPDFAPAWAAQSLAFAVIPNYLLEFKGEPLNAPEVLFLGETTAFRAVELDPNLAEAHLAMAQALRWRRIWGAAEDEYLKAYELDPDNIEIIEEIAEFYYVVGKYKEGLKYAEKGYKLEPLVPLAVASYASNLTFNSRYDEAEIMFKKAIEIQPGFFWPISFLIDQYLGFGEVDKAIALVEGCELCLAQPVIARNTRILIKYRDGEYTPEEIKQILLEENLGAAVGVAFTLGGVDGILDQYETQAFGQPSYNFSTWGGKPFASELVKTDRYKRLVKYLGLVDYWRVWGWSDNCKPVGDDDFECD